MTYALQAGDAELTQALLERLSVENSERKESVAELARSKRERASILNTFQAVLPTDFFLTYESTGFKREGGGTDDNPARHLKIMRSGGDYLD